MRILGLDLGDRWTGVAVSDPSGMLCSPLKTVQTSELETFIVNFISSNPTSEIIYGLPLNQFGQVGEQAKKTLQIVENLKESVTKKEFYDIKFIAWDERRSSLLAVNFLRDNKNSKNKNKTAEHSVAAAFILQNYIDFKNLEKSFK